MEQVWSLQVHPIQMGEDLSLKGGCRRHAQSVGLMAAKDNDFN
jgi:hypothetical protein